MVQINFALREVSCKIVYYGPGMGGKTTNIQVVHDRAPSDHKGKLTSIATEGERTLFFDFLPLNLGTVGGMKTKFQLYTVPGQVYYNATRKLVLEGADGVIFVADSQQSKMEENIESWQNLQDNLKEYGQDIHNLPIVIQYNKRDLSNVSSVKELEEKVNTINAPSFEACSLKGEGVLTTLKALSKLVLEQLNRKQARRTPGIRRKRLAAKPAPKPEVIKPELVTVPIKPASQAIKKGPLPAAARTGVSIEVPAPVKTSGKPARQATPVPKITVMGVTSRQKSKMPYIVGATIAGLVVIGIVILLMKLLG